MNKFTAFLFLLIVLPVFVLSRERGPVKVTSLDGSEVGIMNHSSTTHTHKKVTLENYTTESTWPVSYTLLGFQSYYDLQSNGSPNEIWQNPLAPDNIHAALMVMPVFGSTRFVSYALSTDRGATWSVLGNVAESQSGFPSIDGFSDNGVAVISMHTTAGGVAAARTQFFVDQGAGFGVFDRLDPGLNGTTSLIWGRLITTGTSSNPVKFVNASSENAGTELASVINCTNTSPPGTFGTWGNYDGNTAEQYSLALGQDGRIGLAYIVADAVDQGSVALRESTNGGLSFGSPQVIFDANIAADSLGAFRGISMVYLQNTPCVTYELDMITADGLFPTLPSYIMFWSPNVNGGVPKRIAGPDNVPFYPNIGPSGSYGVFTPLCRPVIGKNNWTGSSMLYLAFNGTTDQIAADSNVYYATFFIPSFNGGETWFNSTAGTSPERITPVSPVKDYRYVSMSHTNSQVGISPGSPDGVYMTVQVHDYAGAFAPNMPPGPSDFLSVRLEIPFFNINTISSNIPESYSLHQNYPNPFNPSTTIKFETKKAEKVSLKVFNSTGQEILTLADNEQVSAGTHEVVFIASELPSGVYFYTMSAGDFRQTKKMILMK